MWKAFFKACSIACTAWLESPSCNNLVRDMPFSFDESLPLPATARSMASALSSSYPSDRKAAERVGLTILSVPPPASFFILTSAKSGSMPVVAQSMTMPIVPVGAITLTWALRKPWREPFSMTRSQTFCAAAARALSLHDSLSKAMGGRLNPS